MIRHAVVGALDKVVIKFHPEGTDTEILELSKSSAANIDRFAIHDKPSAVEKMMSGH